MREACFLLAARRKQAVAMREACSLQGGLPIAGRPRLLGASALTWPPGRDALPCPGSRATGLLGEVGQP